MALEEFRNGLVGCYIKQLAKSPDRDAVLSQRLVVTENGWSVDFEITGYARTAETFKQLSTASRRYWEIVYA